MKEIYNTLADVKRVILALEETGYDLEKIPVLIGDDDELNGVHTSYHEQELLSRVAIEDMQESYTHVSLPKSLQKGKRTDMFYLIS